MGKETPGGLAPARLGFDAFGPRLGGDGARAAYLLLLLEERLELELRDLLLLPLALGLLLEDLLLLLRALGLLLRDDPDLEEEEEELRDAIACSFGE